jgi:hypothetical protein
MQKANKNSSASTVTMDFTLRGTDAQPSTSDAAEIQLQELRACRAEHNRRYAAKKKEEWLARLGGISSTDKIIYNRDEKCLLRGTDWLFK